MGNSTFWILSVKALLISTGLVSMAMLLKLSVPLLMDLAIYEIPLIWSSLLSWLKPPYLYFVINAIIVTIVASSRFHPNQPDDSDHCEPLIPIKPTPPPSDLPVDFAPAPAFEINEAPVLDLKPVVVNGTEVVTHEDENEFVISRSTWTPAQRINAPEEYPFPVPEKPLVSSRFSHRKPSKASPEGGIRALRVAKPKKQETLENTWRTITDGRHVPLTRHLKKSDTWENHGRHVTVESPASPQHVTKSKTFREHTDYEAPPPVAHVVRSSPGSGGKLRKEASLSHDELNRRVEAFIKKFNEEMRLQRQESLNQYMEMVNRGSH